MKILIVNKFLFPKGGSETYIIKLGEELVKQGHEVQYFGMDSPNRCLGNNCNSYVSYVDFHKGSFLNKFSFLFKTIYSVEARKKIRKVLDDFKPDVVHLNNFSYQLTPSIILEIVKWRKLNKRNCKIIFTAHDSNLVCPNHMLYIPNKHQRCKKCLGGKFYNCALNKCIHGSILKSILGAIEGYFWNIKKSYKYIDTIICCSNFMKQIYDTNNLFKNKTIALHNFIDYNNIDPTAIKKQDYVLYFGRYSQEKGINTLIEVCKTLPNIRFVFAGEGPLEKQIHNCKNITNAGFQTGEKLVKLIQQAKFSLYPSEWYENCPFTIMESIANGTPVIASNIGGIPELVQDKFNGELFQVENKEQLRQLILKFYSQNDMLNQYAKNTQEICFLSLEKYVNKLVYIYSEELKV